MNVLDTSNKLSELCGQYTDCKQCVQDEQCGFCPRINLCVPGDLFGPSNHTLCSNLEFSYRQCNVTHLQILLALAAIASFLLIMSFLCFCVHYLRVWKRHRDEEQSGLTENRERDPLLTGYSRRSISFYQWNRNPPPSSNVRRTSLQRYDTQPPWSLSEDDNFEHQRVENLKKKYGKT
ncbi:uncharacterized protein VTP21DRAFT_8067 [Calcarisporiella thermophila]|uniref:uncharacterized protein n=1 Tax=Calcarisporiella thermophila TaxID=911321 RepID=UPI003744646F